MHLFTYILASSGNSGRCCGHFCSFKVKNEFHHSMKNSFSYSAKSRIRQTKHYFSFFESIFSTSKSLLFPYQRHFHSFAKNIFSMAHQTFKIHKCHRMFIVTLNLTHFTFTANEILMDGNPLANESMKKSSFHKIYIVSSKSLLGISTTIKSIQFPYFVHFQSFAVIQN